MTKSVGVVMGSISDWTTMKLCCDILDQFGVEYEKKVISAHRMPDEMFAYAKSTKENGIKVIIAGAGGAAHLPGMLAANTILPVIGVPIQTNALDGMDSLLSIGQMPAGVSVATMAIGNAGAKNAALMACQILALSDSKLAEQLVAFRKEQHDQAKESGTRLD